MDDQYKLSMTVGMDVEAIALLNQKDIWQGGTEGSWKIANDGVLLDENGTEMVFSDGRMKVSAHEDWVEDEDWGSGSVEWAERHGQGDLDVAEDGTITNQNGEVMVLDSDGNLAPAESALAKAIDQANAPTAASEAAKAADVAAREAATAAHNASLSDAPTAASEAAKAADVAAAEAASSASSAPALQPAPEPEPEPAVLVTIELVGVSSDSDLF
jgi:hypothetical protein